MARVTVDSEVELCIDHRLHWLTPAAAFCYAHSLFLAREYQAAAEILQAVEQFVSYARPTNLLLAVCQAAMGDHPRAAHRLRTGLGRVASLAAEELYAALMYQSPDILSDAVYELHAVVHGEPLLTTPCLLLGDLFSAIGQSDYAAQYWKLAIQRDIPGGPVAVTAQRQLARLARKSQSRPPARATAGYTDARERSRPWSGERLVQFN
jgi:hypothetical protein